MNKGREGVKYAAVLAGVVLCYSLALISWYRLSERPKIHMFYQENQPLDGSTAAAQQKENDESEEALTFTFWGSKKGEQLTNQEYGRSEQVTVYYLCGDSRNLFVGEPPLDLADYEGCLISGNTAYRLFGSRNVKGFTIAYNDREYIIRGVLEETDDAIAIQADEKAKAVLSGSALRIPAGKPAAAAVEQYQEQYGGDKEIDLAEVTGYAQVFAVLLPLIILCRLLFRGMTEVWKLRRMPMRFVTYLLGVLLILVLYVWASDGIMRLPLGISPAKWSDFSYWQTFFQEGSNRLWDMITIEKQAVERLYLHDFLRVAGYGSAATLLYLLFRKRLRQSGFRQCYVSAAICILVVFGTLMCSGNTGYAAANSKVLWLLPLIALLAGLCLGGKETSG